MKSPYRPVPSAEEAPPSSTPEIDVTDITSPIRRATPGKFIDCLVLSDGANLRFPFLPPASGVANDDDDAANMQIVPGGVRRLSGVLGDETLYVNPETGVIVPLKAPSMEMPPSDCPQSSSTTAMIKKSHANSESSSGSSSDSRVSIESTHKQSFIRKLFAVFLLFFINLLNYVDRYTIAGVLSDVMDFYSIGKGQAGLLQTLFIVAYMLFAPAFGYLGDRYNRVVILIVGIFFWSLTTLLGSFVPSNYFWLFGLLRGAVGIGEASYSTVAPTIIADLFSDKMRTVMLTLFYFAIPVGSGLGYIVGSHVRDAFGHWQWALRVTPVFGVTSVVLLALFIRDPPRGESDGGHRQQASSSWLRDIKALLCNPSFVFSTWGFTAVCFVSGALAHWTPHLTELAFKVRGLDASAVAFTFGGITVAAGIGGVISGSLLARMWKNRGQESADALVCAIGLLLCAPFLVAVILRSQGNPSIFWLLVFIAEFFLCLNWAVVADILFYVVIPTRRSTAEALQILVSHLFGDAGSPYLIGLVADVCKVTMEDENMADFIPLKNALYMTVAACAVGGVFFLICATFIVRDKRRAEELTKLNELGVLENVEGLEGPNLNIYPIDVVVTETGRQDYLLPPKDDRIGQLRNDSQCSTATATSIESAATDNSDA